MIKRNTLSLIAIMILAGLITACGGGGGSNGRVTGTITDNWGAPIGGNAVTIIFAGLETVYHPDETGAFDLSIPEGTYSVEFLWYDNDQGIEVYYTDSVTVVKGQTLNLGNVPLSNSELTSAATSSGCAAGKSTLLITGMISRSASRAK